MGKYIIPLVVFLLLISSCLVGVSNTTEEIPYNIDTLRSNSYNGSLSGFVNDSFTNPIMGVRVRVYFHGTYEENYTDSTGYYHVTNIRICNCTKNATASKEGYKTEWVLLSIDENTTYDFVLTPLGNILYVGGDGPGNYSTIQEAIDNASDGDTVFVYSGWYDVDKWIKINKSIRLIGENKYNTIINSCWIDIVVPEVFVSGFTIQNGSSITITSYSLEVANNNTISGNIFKSNESLYEFGGITIFNSSYNTISYNSFFNCGLLMDILDIFDVANSHHNIVYNNTVNGKPLVYFEDTSNKIIEDAGQVILIGCDNISVDNLELSNTVIGVQLLDSINCFIVGNVFSNNNYGGISLGNSNNNTIMGNIILNSGTGTFLVASKYNTISGNSFENNGINIIFFNTSCNHISDNNFKYSNYLRSLKSIFSIDSDNKWVGNFWNRPRLLPVLIWGFKLSDSSYFLMRRSLDIDWRPALRPYDVDGEDSLIEGRNILFCRRDGGFRLCPIGGLRNPLQLLLSSFSSG